MILNMKIRELILLGLVLLGRPAIGTAQFDYFIANGSVTVTGYTGTNYSIAIPDTIAGLPVTAISTFYSSVGETNITIPESVANISSEAFAFQGQLTALFVKDQNSYYSSSNGVLLDKDQLTLVEAPPAIAGHYAIPGTVTSIDDNAFTYCADLSSVTIPNSVTNIGFEAFFDCGSLTNMAIGPNVINLGDGAFAGCSKLTAITVDAQNQFFSSSNGVLFDKPQLTLIQAPGGLTGPYVIPAGVTSVGAGAFEDCASLTSVVASDSVTNIGSEAFQNCAMTNLVLGTNLASIGDNAFAFCNKLTSMVIPNSVTSLGVSAFQYCSDLGTVTLGTNLPSIGNSTFLGCSSLSQLSVPNSVAVVGNNALENCSGLTNLTLGTQVAVIGNNAFDDCGRLTSVAIPASVTNIGSGVFSGCGSLTAIVVDGQSPAYGSAGGILFNKSQTTLIQMPAQFVGNFALPDSVTNISNGALAGCPLLTAITASGKNLYFTTLNGVLFDKSVTTLIQFPGAVGGSYTVSNGLSSLGNTAFLGCSNLTSISIPSSITNVGSTTFLNCPHTGIYFAGNAPQIAGSGIIIPGGTLTPIFGNTFYNSNSEAVYYLPGTTGWGARFDGLNAYLFVPPYVCTPSSNSITIAGFIGSGNTVAIPNTINGLPVTALASGVFDNAAGVALTNVILGTNLTTIGEYAFAACDNLTSITIPDSVTNLGSGAFAFCDNLTSVYFQGNAPEVGGDVFFQWGGFPIFNPVYEPPTPTTVYYLPGTTGWSTNFAGQPAVLWNPEAQMSDGSFGVGAGGFGFNVTGSSNLVVVVEASTNLSGLEWQPLQTITLTAGSAYFNDPQWTNSPGRFYRLRSP
jgi:hypothetical protein